MSRIFSGEAGPLEALRRHLRSFTPVSVPSGGSGGSRTTVITGGGSGGGGGGGVFGGDSASTNTSQFSHSGTLITGTGTFKLPFSQSATIIDVMLAVGVAPDGDDIIVDINKNGTTIYPTATKPTILDGNDVGTEYPPDEVDMTNGDYLTVDVDQVGSTTPGSDLVVVVEWRPT